MIAVAILTVILSLIMSILTLFNNKIAYVNLKRDVEILEGQLKNAFSTSVSCERNLTTNAVDLFGADASLSMASVRLYDNGGAALDTIIPALGPLPNSRLIISDIWLTSPSNPFATPPPGPVLLSTNAGVRTFAASLRVGLAHTVDGAPALPRLFLTGLTILTNNPGAPSGCQWARASQVCVTGEYQPAVPSTAILFSSPGFSGVFTDVFTVIVPGAEWGLRCNPLWNAIGCSHSQLISPLPGTLSPQIIMGGNECKSPASTIGPDSKIILTCCQIQ